LDFFNANSVYRIGVFTTLFSRAEKGLKRRLVLIPEELQRTPTTMQT